MYMLQPSRIYIGDNVNTFCHGKAFSFVCTTRCVVCSNII